MPGHSPIGRRPVSKKRSFYVRQKELVTMRKLLKLMRALSVLTALFLTLLLTGCESVVYPNGPPGSKQKIVHKPPVDYKKIVNSLLDRYTKSFNRRDEYGLNRIRHYIFTDDAEIIYGNACGPNSFGWCIGGEEIVKAIQTDWNYWESISFNEKNLNLKNSENCVWFSTTGNLIVTKKIEEQFQKINKYYFEYKKKNNKKDYDVHTDVIHMLFDLLFDDTEDGCYDVKFVVSGVVEKCGDDWKIAQLHSSYPISFDLGRGDQ